MDHWLHIPNIMCHAQVIKTAEDGRLCVVGAHTEVAQHNLGRAGSILQGIHTDDVQYPDPTSSAKNGRHLIKWWLKVVAGSNNRMRMQGV